MTGDTNSTWGARRARDGHPAPFKLEYVEIGNEDGADQQIGSYEGRFAQFFDAIKTKYPQIKVIATTPVTTRAADIIDEHYYRRSEEEMAFHANDYDTRRRMRGQQVFVGEWATRVGDPTPTLGAALGDAAFMIGMERNSDLVTMAAYAPLFVNVNPGGMQWVTDLIGYDTMNSYGSPTYQAQKIFSLYHGDDVVSITAQRIPTREWQPPAGRGFGPPPPAVAGRGGATQPAAQPAPGNAGGEPPQGGAGRGGRGNAPAGPQQLPMPLQVPMVFADATRDSKTGVIYVKVVNRAATPQQVHLVLSGITSVEPAGQIVTISGNTPADTNSITGPAKIVPVTSKVSGLGSDFTRTFAPYSINVLQLTAK